MLSQRAWAGRVLDEMAVRDLQTHLLGSVILPHHERYEEARSVVNGLYNRRPALIVEAADTADVIRAVNFARDHELPLAVRSGGHSVAGHSTVDGGLVIDLGRMRGISIDPERRVAWAQPGLTWGEYARRAQVHGLATTSGDAATVGLGGLALGGGIGWMVRKYGLTIDHLISVELVTADGRLIRASADEHPDLFWALRGGGGNFGVATAFQLKLQPAGTILGGVTVYPATREVLRAYVDRAGAAPDELTTIGSVMLAPPASFIPAHLQGSPVLMLMMCYVGDLDEGQRVVAPLRSLATPIADLVGPMPYPEMFALNKEAEARGLGLSIRSTFLDRFGDEVVDAILTQINQPSSPMSMAQIRVLGGAMARVPIEATAFPHRQKPYMLTIINLSPDPTQMAEHHAWTERFWNMVRPHGEGVYVNFLDDEGEARTREAYTASSYARLAEVKRRYDPTNLFRLNQNITPAR